MSMVDNEKINVRGFETVGDIAIISLPIQLNARQLKQIKSKAREILKHKHINTVLLKCQKVGGKIRTASYMWLAGQRKTQTVHKENGCIMHVDLAKVYFSARLSSERLFIAQDIVKHIKSKKSKYRKASIAVLFCGIAPYALVLARQLKLNKINATIECVDINAYAIKLAKINVKLNGFNNINVVRGDVKNITRLFRKKFDFVLALRPQTDYDFIKEVLSITKKHGIVYYRDFVNAVELGKLKQQIVEKAKTCGFNVKVLSIRKAGQIKPRFWRVLVKMVKL